MEEKKCYKVYLTVEQAEDLQGFINFNNWDTDLQLGDETTSNVAVEQDSAEVQVTRHNTSTNRGLPSRQVVACTTTPPQAAENNHVQDISDCDDSECSYCFCRPCVTTYPQRWLRSGKRPKAGNSSTGKIIYKEFWKLIDGYGGWNDDRYLHKKEANLREVEDDWNVWISNRRGDRHVREIMPDCVLQTTRDLYPNPKGIPYMGHKWQ